MNKITIENLKERMKISMDRTGYIHELKKIINTMQVINEKLENYDYMSTVHEATLKKYDLEHQMLMTFEKMTELQVEICRYMKNKNDELSKDMLTEHFAKKITNVEIMLDQIKCHLNIHDAVEINKMYELTQLGKELNNNKGGQFNVFTY